MFCVCLHLCCPVCPSPQGLGWSPLGMGCEQRCLGLGGEFLLQRGFVGLSPCLKPPPSHSPAACMPGERCPTWKIWHWNLHSILPCGSVGLLRFYPFPIPFPELELLSLTLLGRSSGTSHAVSPSCTICRTQGAPKPGALPGASPLSLVPCPGSGAGFFHSLFCVFWVCAALEEPSAPGCLSVDLGFPSQTASPAHSQLWAGFPWSEVSSCPSHRLMPRKTDELVFAASSRAVRWQPGWLASMGSPPALSFPTFSSSSRCHRLLQALCNPFSSFQQLKKQQFVPSRPNGASPDRSDWGGAGATLGWSAEKGPHAGQQLCRRRWRWAGLGFWMDLVGSQGWEGINNN